MNMTKPDWEAIESAYRAGSLSIRAIAEKHGVSHTAINNRAAKEGWQRDLTQKVRAATQANVSSKVSRDSFQTGVESDAEIVDRQSLKRSGYLICQATLTFPRTVDVLIPRLTCFSLITGLIESFSDNAAIVETITNSYGHDADHR